MFSRTPPAFSSRKQIAYSSSDVVFVRFIVTFLVHFYAEQAGKSRHDSKTILVELLSFVQTTGFNDFMNPNWRGEGLLSENYVNAF